MYEIMQVLGKDSVIERLNKAIKQLIKEVYDFELYTSLLNIGE